MASHREKGRTDGHPAHPPEEPWGLAQHGLNVAAESADAWKKAPLDPCMWRFGQRLSGFTVEPRDGDGLQEAQGDDGATHAEFLQKLDHVGAALRTTSHARSSRRTM